MSPTLADTTTNNAELEDVIDEVQRAEIIALVRIELFPAMNFEFQCLMIRNSISGKRVQLGTEKRGPQFLEGARGHPLGLHQQVPHGPMRPRKGSRSRKICTEYAIHDAPRAGKTNGTNIDSGDIELSCL